MAQIEVLIRTCDLPHDLRVGQPDPEGKPFGVMAIDDRGRKQQYTVDLCEQHARRTVQLLILNGRKVK